MKLLFIGDPHIDDSTPESRSDNYGDTVLLKLEWCFSLAKQKGIEYVVLAGDTFERTLQSIAFRLRVKALFRKAQADGLVVWSLVGNHPGDTVYSKYETHVERQLGEFFADGLIHNLTGLSTSVKGFLGLSAYWKPDLTDEQKQAVKLIFTHTFLDISDPKLSYKVTDLMREYPNVEAIFSGHDHKWYPVLKFGKTQVFRPGSLMRVSNDESSQRIPAVVVYDTDTRKYEEVQVAVALPPEQVFHQAQKQVKDSVKMRAKSFAESLQNIDTVRTGVSEMLHAQAQQLPSDDKQIIITDLIQAGFKK